MALAGTPYHRTMVMLNTYLAVVLALLSCPTCITTGTLAPPETCAGWPLPGKTTSFAGPGRWQHVGNHRVELHVTHLPTDGSTAVRVSIPWARHDANVEIKGMVVMSATTDLVVPNCSTISSSNEMGDVVFSAAQGPGLYHLYYMPYANGDYAADKLLVSCNDKPTEWLPKLDAVPNATVGRLQSRTAFDAFGEMEMAATAAQVDAVVQRWGGKDGVLLVTENRYHPVRMRRHLPQRWITRSEPLSHFETVVAPGEHLHFQVALYASLSNVSIVGVRFSNSLSALDPLCANLDGSDYWGRPYVPSAASKRVMQGMVRSFYMMTSVPSDTAGGAAYIGTVTLVGANAAEYVATVNITVHGQASALQNGGDDQLWRNTRLHWLNSKLGLGDHRLPSPFTPVVLNASHRSVLMLGKKVTIGPDGMLSEIDVFSDPLHPENITQPLASSTRFQVTVGGASVDLPVVSDAKPVVDEHNRTVSWNSVLGDAVDAGCHGLRVGVRASLDFSGYADYVVTLNASVPVDQVAVSVVLPMAPKNARFAVGLGRKGGLLSTWFTRNDDDDDANDDNANDDDDDDNVEWKWDGVNGNNALWVGDSRAGLRVFPKGESDEWQAAVPFDSRLTPPMPEEWANNGTGGISVSPTGKISVFTGERNLGKGQGLVFRFSVLITPTRPLNLTKHWGERHYQASGPVNYTAVANGGATVLVEHQGNVINPWINYPYATNQLMREASTAAHAAGMKFKIYNTMRELSYKAREIWAFRSLEETYVSGPDPHVDGEGSPWLQEHLQGDYEVAWSNTMAQPIDQGNDMWWSQQEDHAIKVKAMTRWNNYYVYGSLQMQRDFDFDGIYLDEIAYDRVTILRTKAVLNNGLIDHHCHIGAFCTSCAANYMELYPFIDSLWYGEAFDYVDATPDYWLAEISGLMFGLAAEMLRYSGMTPMHFRGLAHGMSNRWQPQPKGPTCPDEFAVSPACDPFDPRDIWALQDQFGIAESVMVGWWEQVGTLPVQSDVEAVVVTTYLRKGTSALVVLANFGKDVEDVHLDFDWGLLGMEASRSTLRVPGLRVPVQPARESVALNGAVKVPALTRGAIDSTEGVVLILERQ